MNNTSLQPSKKRIVLWQQILIGMILGTIVGIILGPTAEVLKPIGTLFINAIKMLIVPLVFCSLIVGVTSMQDTAKMGRIGIKAIVIYLSTTAVAITIGLLFAVIFAPGEGLNMVASNTDAAGKEAPSVVQTLLNIIPKNPVQAMSSGNILQIIFFALGLGIALSLVGEKAKPAIALFESFAEAMYKLTELVMKIAPYGVFGLMAWVAGKYGLDVLLPLLGIIGLVYFGCILHVLIVYTGILSMVSGLNPIRYLKGLVNPAIVAFTTTSSSATLPVSIKAAREKLGVSKGISSFVLPLGATINMDGTALYQGVCAIFIAQAFGIDLSMSDYMLIILTSTLASIGTAGVPGAGLIMLSLVLTTVGLPLEGLAIVAGVDRILDMARTTVNVCGDLMVSTVVAKSENELDRTIYNNTAVNNTSNEQPSTVIERPSISTANSST